MAHRELGDQQHSAEFRWMVLCKSFLYLPACFSCVRRKIALPAWRKRCRMSTSAMIMWATFNLLSKSATLRCWGVKSRLQHWSKQDELLLVHRNASMSNLMACICKPPAGIEAVTCRFSSMNCISHWDNLAIGTEAQFVPRQWGCLLSRHFVQRMGVHTDIVETVAPIWGWTIPVAAGGSPCGCTLRVLIALLYFS